MKKILSLFALAAMSVTLFTACSSDDDDNNTPAIQPVKVSDGVFFVCSGNESNSINGCLTYLNTTTNAINLNAFLDANGRELGSTPNDALVYGSKMYIAVTGENTVEVVDRNTLVSIKQIKTTETIGTDKGLKPRHLVAYNGKVYVSTYGTNVGYAGDGTIKGYVAAIDTTSYTCTTYDVGAYPEGMAVNGGKLYVANSSYGKGSSPSISEVDLSSGTVKDITDNLVKNPVSISVGNDGALYILDSGSYDSSYTQIGACVLKYANGSFTKIADASYMAMNGDGTSLYYINSPYSYSPHSAKPTCYVFNITTGVSSTFNDGSDILYPAGIGVDPINGDVYIMSYILDEYGYPSYSLNGYAVKYNVAGTKQSKFNIGTGPTTVAFNTVEK